MQLFTDNPVDSIKNDTFGYKHYAEDLKEVILHTTPLPFCVGIFGPWGSGKSSFMQMLQGLITKAGIQTIWFNPWKYDTKEDLWNALIQTILDYITTRSKDDVVLKKAGELALAATWLALKKAITALTAGVITEANLEDTIARFNEKEKIFYQHINQFEDHFAEVVDRYCAGDKLVIFIDDLDRCLPENAITVLESLKLYIGHAKCIFVIGIDHYVVEAGIRYRYGDKIEINGRDYLDKIIQIPFYLPAISYTKLRDSLLRPELTLSEEVWRIIQSGMGGNPRKTKRFINSFYLLQLFFKYSDSTTQNSTSITLSQEEQDVYLAKLLVFQMSFADFYQHLQLYPDDWQYLEKYLIQMQQRDEEQAQKNLKERERLDRFWKNPSLEAFIRKTSEDPFTQAPDGEIVTLLLEKTNLVSDTPTSG